MVDPQALAEIRNVLRNSPLVGIRSSPSFVSVEELHAPLQEFADRFNNLWIIGRLDYKTPAQHRRSLLVEGA